MELYRLLELIIVSMLILHIVSVHMNKLIRTIKRHDAHIEELEMRLDIQALTIASLRKK